MGKKGKNEIQGRLGFLKTNSFSLFNKVPSIDKFAALKLR